MNIEVSFPGGKRVAARVGNHLIETDQPLELGGQDAAPAPFDLFLASLATCTGIYVLGFIEARGLSSEGLKLVQHVAFDPATHLPESVHFELILPKDFPEKYRSAILRTAANCKVKKSLLSLPKFVVSIGGDEGEAALQPTG